ncbi:MAG: PAS domain S-box protein, partial [Desulfobacterota bacterium]|nr:PAS domain S-box protein [Thermodesulfobacteriota bacterium]
SSPYGLVLSRLSDGLMVEVNNGFEHMTGYSAEETIGRKSTEMQLWAENEQRGAVVAKVEQKGGVRDEEVRFRRKNGELFYGNFSAQTITMKNETYLLSSFIDITARKKAQQEREELIAKLQKALSEIKTLRGFIPICSSCKKIRDDKGYWTQIEAYIRDHSEAEFTHGLCPDCLKKLYPDLED